MHDNRQHKRQWLRLVGILDAGQPSTPQGLISRDTVLSGEVIHSTLGRIQDDDFWIANACLDIVQNSSLADASGQLAPIRSNSKLIRQILHIGLRATEKVAQSCKVQLPPSTSEETYDLLAIRRRLLSYNRKLDMWEKVYGLKADANFSVSESSMELQGAQKTGLEDKDDEVFDAWKDAADTTPSPVPQAPSRPLPIDFLNTSLLEHITQLALTYQPQLVSSLMKVCSPVMAFNEIFPYRISLVKTLVHACGAANLELSQMAAEDLFPRYENHIETGLWAQALQHNSSNVDSDITDENGIQEQLKMSSYNHDLPHSYEFKSKQIDPLTPSDLACVYRSLIHDLDSNFGATHVALQLALLATSEEFGIGTQKDLVHIAKDLRLFARLIYSLSSSQKVRSWTLEEFQQECVECDSSKRLAKLSAKFLETAHSERETLESFFHGSIPLIESIRGRTTRETLAFQFNETPEGDIVDMLLELASQGRYQVLRYLLSMKDKDQQVLCLDRVKRIALAAMLGSPNTDNLGKKEIGELFVASKDSAIPIPAKHPDSLHSVLGAILSSSASSISPNSIYKLLLNVPEHVLPTYFTRCQALLEASQRLLGYAQFASVSWLIGLEDDRDKQLAGVTRIINNCATSARSTERYSNLSMILMDSVSTNQALDKLDQKDIARLIVDGASQSGDVQLFDNILHEEGDGILSSEEREEVLFKAVRRLYDNSQSANLHQGNLKVAYDILQKLPVPLSPRLLREKEFIEATSRLCSYRLQSIKTPGKHLTPFEIRHCKDRLALIQQLLSSKEDAYKMPDLVMDLAQKLCAPGASEGVLSEPKEDQGFQRVRTETHVLGLLCEAAMAQGDYTQAQRICESLVSTVAKFAKRAEQVKASANVEPPNVTLQAYADSRDVAHRTCHQLAKQPDWDDLAGRLRWAAYALAYCPQDQVGRYLTIWRDLAKQLEEAFQANPPGSLLDELDRNTRSDVASLGLRDGLSATLHSAALGGTNAGNLGMSGLAALSQFGGSLESYTNPLGALFSRAPSALRPLATSNQSSNTKSPSHIAIPEEQNSPTGRAARLFDGIGSTHASQDAPSYLDPAERAARAARRFFGGLS